MDRNHLRGQSCKERVDNRRKDREESQLKAILGQNPEQFRKVYISRSSAPDMSVQGYVRTDEDLAQLRAEITKQMGKAWGRPEHLWVHVVPPGTIMQGDTTDFWSK